jgi:hypothetical protein
LTLPVIENSTTNAGDAKYEALILGCILPWKFLFPESTATEKIFSFSIVFAKFSSKGPELPLQVVHPKPTTLKPN